MPSAAVISAAGSNAMLNNHAFLYMHSGSFNVLPQHCQISILKNLNLVDKLVLRKVSRAWRDNLEFLLRSQQVIGTTAAAATSVVSPQQTHPFLLSTSHRENLELNSKVLSFCSCSDLGHLQSKKNVLYKRIHFDQLIRLLINYCPKVSSLYLNGIDVDLKWVKLNLIKEESRLNLKHLEFNNCRFYGLSPYVLPEVEFGHLIEFLGGADLEHFAFSQAPVWSFDHDTKSSVNFFSVESISKTKIVDIVLNKCPDLAEITLPSKVFCAVNLNNHKIRKLELSQLDDDSSQFSRLELLEKIAELLRKNCIQELVLRPDHIEQYWDFLDAQNSSLKVLTTSNLVPYYLSGLEQLIFTDLGPEKRRISFIGVQKSLDLVDLSLKVLRIAATKVRQSVLRTITGKFFDLEELTLGHLEPYQELTFDVFQLPITNLIFGLTKGDILTVINLSKLRKLELNCFHKLDDATVKTLLESLQNLAHFSAKFSRNVTKSSLPFANQWAVRRFPKTVTFEVEKGKFTAVEILQATSRPNLTICA